MPWAKAEDRRAHRRKMWGEKRADGWKRDFGRVPAVCPVCEKERTLSKNGLELTKRRVDERGRIVQRCKSCSRRKDYAPWMDSKFIVAELSRKRRAQKIRAIQHLGGRCVQCELQYDGTNAYAFDFHHTVHGQKDFSPGSKFMAWSRVEAELARCDLLCAICHRSKHSESY